ncbi:ATP-binding cassette domain-containing protein [Rhodocyclus tenuis]|uniref:Cell division ATP-binding protein FtsE n=2 Tax=Rhodocyclus TaxID=1064 RepID=A0A6L5JVJ9_RHOTE|nr:ATP-binding cassette domain-containing protein [Rhodocyclus gracilis]MQY50198.1 ATP-binding cassette domain-containing protein [Rhodocyclus gracilis]NJA87656.1 ATP-binding cassette domain-containing protein [Rhodocyclus gracilis]
MPTSTAKTGAAIRLTGVTKHFAGSATAAVHPTDLAIEAGEIHGIIGFSGAGKSTLLRLVNLLERPDAGLVEVGDDELSALPPLALRAARRRIGMIFQQFNLLHNLSVAENVAFPLRIAGDSPASIKARVAECLDYVGLSAKAAAYPGQLSGGQKQRVAIARALAPNPGVLLADEPTSALDPRTTQSILDVLADINQRFGVTVLLVTHEMSVVRRLCHRVSVMDEGRIVEQIDLRTGFTAPRSELARWLFASGEASPAEATQPATVAAATSAPATAPANTSAAVPANAAARAIVVTPANAPFREVYHA